MLWLKEKSDRAADAVLPQRESVFKGLKRAVDEPLQCPPGYLHVVSACLGVVLTQIWLFKGVGEVV